MGEFQVSILIESIQKCPFAVTAVGTWGLVFVPDTPEDLIREWEERRARSYYGDQIPPLSPSLARDLARRQGLGKYFPDGGEGISPLSAPLLYEKGTGDCVRDLAVALGTSKGWIYSIIAAVDNWKPPFPKEVDDSPLYRGGYEDGVEILHFLAREGRI